MAPEDPSSCILLISNAISIHQIDATHILSFLVLTLLIVASAFISGSEVAFFGLETKDKEELKLEKHSSDKTVLNKLKNLDYLLATILTANNFINVGIVLISSHLTNQIFDFSQNPTMGFIIQTIVITFILLLFGEILPKVYASNHSLPFARLMAKPINFLGIIFRPLNMFLVESTNLVNRRMEKKNTKVSRDELSTALELTSEELTDEKELLEGIIKFGNISVADIMTARVDVIDIDIKSDFETVIKVIIDSGFSRIPVFGETSDNVKGILYIKDLLPHLQKKNFRWQSLIRPPYFVPETKMINDLLEEFQTSKVHMAIIVDEYGGTSGIVTLENVLEEIVGEISDEFDGDRDNYETNKDGTMTFEGKTAIHEFCKVTKIEEELFNEIKGEADSLAGMLLEVHGRMPVNGDYIDVLTFHFKILDVDDRRISKVKYYPVIKQ